MDDEDLDQSGAAASRPTADTPRAPSSPLSLLAETPDAFGGLTPEALMGEARKFTDSESPFRARAAGYMKPAASFSEAYGNALSGYADAKTKQEELAAKYFPVVARVAQQRQQMKMAQEANQRALLDATAGASLMDPNLSREGLERQVAGLVQQGRIPGALAENFLKTLPTDPAELRRALTVSALSRQDPYRAVQKPELRNVAQDATLVSIDPVTQRPTTVAQGAEKKIPFEKALQKLLSLPPGDPQRKYWETYLSKLMTHQPPTQVSVSTEKPLLASFMDTLGKNLADAHSAAQGAVGTIGTVDTLLGVLDAPNMIGPGATASQILGRLAEVGGFGGKDNRERLANTKVALQQLAQLELEAGAMMKGQGAITESERVILRAASAGNLWDNVNEIKAGLSILKQRAKKRIAYYNSRAKQLQAIPGLERVAPLIMVDPGDPTGEASVIDFDASGRPLAPGKK